MARPKQIRDSHGSMEHRLLSTDLKPSFPLDQFEVDAPFLDDRSGGIVQAAYKEVKSWRPYGYTKRRRSRSEEQSPSRHRGKNSHGRLEERWGRPRLRL